MCDVCEMLGDAEKLVIVKEPSGDIIVNNPSDSESHTRELDIDKTAQLYNQRLLKHEVAGGTAERSHQRRLVQADRDAAEEREMRRAQSRLNDRLGFAPQLEHEHNLPRVGYQVGPLWLAWIGVDAT